MEDQHTSSTAAELWGSADEAGVLIERRERCRVYKSYRVILAGTITDTTLMYSIVDLDTQNISVHGRLSKQEIPLSFLFESLLM